MGAGRIALAIFALVFLRRRWRTYRETRSTLELLRVLNLVALLALAITWQPPVAYLVGVLVLATWTHRLWGRPVELAELKRDLTRFERMSSARLQQQLQAPDPRVRSAVIEALATRKDATALEALTAQAAGDADANNRALAALHLARTGHRIDLATWHDILRSENLSAEHVLRAVQEVSARKAMELVPSMLGAAARLARKSGRADDAAVLAVTHAALDLQADDALSRFVERIWLQAYVRAVTERFAGSGAAIDLLEREVERFGALLVRKDGPPREGAQQLDWLLQARALRRELPGFARDRAAPPEHLARSPDRVRFCLQEALRWDAQVTGALELAPGWHEAECTAEIEREQSAETGSDYVRLRLELQADGSRYQLDAVLDPWSLLELTLQPATPRAFYLRAPDPWRAALRDHALLRRVRGLNDARDVIHARFEEHDVAISLKYQGPVFDIALVHEADEARVLLAVEGVTADLPQLDERAELPVYLCALRIETLLRSLESVEADEDAPPPNPRVRKLDD